MGMHRISTGRQWLAYLFLGAWLCLAAPLQAQQWLAYDGIDHAARPEGAGAAPVDGGAICQEHRAGFYCIVVGCLARQPIGVYLVSDALARNGLRSAELFVDGKRLGALTLDRVPGVGGIFGTVLPPAETRPYLSRLRAGNRLEIRLQDGSDMLSYVSTLRNSSRAIGHALARCPAPGTGLPGQLVGQVDGQLDGGGSAVAEPLHPLEALFVANGCTASETQIFDLLSDGGRSIGDGQALFRIWSSAPDFETSYDVIGRSPFVYRWKTGPCAG